jgi:hypothetical protein
MGRPFIVVRTELAPDFADPETRRALAAKAISSGAEIFGPAEAERPLVRVAPAEVVDELASVPDFADADVRAEEAADAVDEDADAGIPITDAAVLGDPGAEALLDAVAEPAAAAVPDEPEPAAAEPALEPTEPDAAPASAAACDDCGASLTPAVVAYCQSPRGQATFSGANYCYLCQKKHRPARSRKAVA